MTNFNFLDISILVNEGKIEKKKRAKRLNE